MRLLISALFAVALLPGQTLSIASGNGQIVLEQFLSGAPLVVQAKDAAGKPAAGVAVNWAISQGLGTLVGPTGTTDSSGLASTSFLATSVQPGMSFQQATVTAGSGANTVSFVVTTSISRQSGGGLAAPPLVELLSPPANNRLVTGTAGSTIAGGVVVRVTAQSGFQAGTAIPNVGVRIVPNPDSNQPSATCAAPAGIVLTDSHGVATCDLALGSQIGSNPLVARVGEIQDTPPFNLQVTPGPVCTYAISPLVQSFTASPNLGSVSIATGAGCSWTAIASDSWISPSQTSGSGSFALTYAITANGGNPRAGTLTVAGQVLNISQAGGSGPLPLTITTASNLPVATLGIGYSTALQASGGSGSYQWSLTSGSLPFGFQFANTGRITGTASSAGTSTFTATVVDTVSGATQSQVFTLTVLANNGTLLITNTGFPNGSVGQTYSQTLTSSAGCTTPFSPVPIFRVVSGALPPGLAIQQIPSGAFSIAGTPTTTGTYLFSLTVSDACGSISGANFTITIGNTQTGSLTVTPASLQFAAQLGSATAPPSQTISVSSPGPISFSTNATTTSGGTWLQVNPVNATTPSSIVVSIVNSAQLQPGTYSGTVSITTTATSSPVVVPVILTVSTFPILTVSPSTIAATLPNSGATISRQSIVVNSAGGQPLTFTASASTATGAPWLSVSPSAGSTPSTVLAILNAAGLSAGTYSGSIVINAAGGQQVVSVTLSVTTAITLSVSPPALVFTFAQGLTPASQSISVSSTAGVTSYSASASTTAGGNWLSVSPTSGTTPIVLTVSANPGTLAAGTYTGLISIQAPDPLIASLNIPVTFNVAPNAPSVVAVTNAASFAPGPVAPGEFITIFGARMGPDAGVSFALNSDGLIDTQLSSTQVLFDNIPAPLIYSQSGQVSAIVPFELAGRASTVVQVAYRGIFSNSINLRVVDASPAVFVTDATNGQGAILNQDGSVNSSQNGAAPGSIVSIFGTGAGQTNPAGVNGQIIGSTLPLPLLPVHVQIGGVDVPVLYAGSAPGLPAGVIQINAKVPSGLPSGVPASMVISAGNAISISVTLSIQ